MSELKPCPFCGGKAELSRFQEAECYWVSCNTQGCEIEIACHPCSASAKKTWNTRAPDPRVEKMTNTLLNIVECVEMRHELYVSDEQALLVVADKARAALAEWEEGRDRQQEMNQRVKNLATGVDLFPPKECVHWFPMPFGCAGSNCKKKAYVLKDGECPCAEWDREGKNERL